MAHQIADDPLYSDANLQGYWKLESNFTDSSPNGYTLTATGTPGDVAGKFNNGKNFDGSTYASIASAANLEITGSQTWSCWVRPNAIASNKRFMAKVTTGLSAYRLLYMLIDGTVGFLMTGLSAGAYSPAGAIVAGNWYHIVGRFDISTHISDVFINGVKYSTATTGTPDATANHFAIASDVHTGHANCVMDDVAVFNRALTDIEISRLYSGNIKKFMGVAKSSIKTLNRKGISGASATGGTITTSGTKTIHTFKLADSGTAFIPKSPMNVSVLVVGGGGSGCRGGGGGGGYQYNASLGVIAQSYTVTVGDGGSGGTGSSKGTNGQDSVFSTITAVGGGAGGLSDGTDAANKGSDGGCGGGGGASSSATTTAGTGSQGGNGGTNGGQTSSPYAAGGGGGSGGNGGNASSNTVAGNGGVGTANSISGVSVTYGGGGGGCIYNAGSNTPGTGGSGGGGNGGQGSNSGGNGTDDLGGGGGGTGSGGTAGSGGSGIVIISYETNQIKKFMGISNI